MIDRNFILQAAGQGIALVGSPLVIHAFGFKSFGEFSLLLSYATATVAFLTFRSEVCFSMKDLAEFKRSYLVGKTFFITITCFIFFFTAICILPSYFMEKIGIARNSFLNLSLMVLVLGGFSILNYYAIATHRYLYSTIQFFKNLFFYILALFPVVGDFLGLSVTFSISIIISAFFILRWMSSCGDLPGIREVTPVGCYPLLKQSIPYMGAAGVSLVRESITAGLIAAVFSSEAAGVYFFMSQFLVKPLQTYSTVVANKIRFDVSNKGVLNKFNLIHDSCLVLFFYMIFIGVFGFFIHYPKNIFLSSWSFLLIGVSYIFFMPITVLFEIYSGGISNFIFSVIHAGVALILSIVAIYFSLNEFVLLNAFIFFLVYMVQCLYALKFFPVCWE